MNIIFISNIMPRIMWQADDTGKNVKTFHKKNYSSYMFKVELILTIKKSKIKSEI